MLAGTVLGQVEGLGEGRIDNWIVSSSVHVATGAVVVVSMVVATVLVTRHALAGRPVDRSTKLILLVAQIALIMQALLGIKLLDQGQGIVQLYIHYIGGLLPLGLFLIAGWFARGDSAWSSRVLALLVLIGTVSAVAAFFIGRAYANA